MSLLPKDLVLIVVGSRVGRHDGDIIMSVTVTGRRPVRSGWMWGVHRGHIATGMASACTWQLGEATADGFRLPQPVVVGDADEAPDGGPPFVELLGSRREVEEQLRAPKLPLAWVAATVVWIVARFDF